MSTLIAELDLLRIEAKLRGWTLEELKEPENEYWYDTALARAQGSYTVRHRASSGSVHVYRGFSFVEAYKMFFLCNPA